MDNNVTDTTTGFLLTSQSLNEFPGKPAVRDLLDRLIDHYNDHSLDDTRDAREVRDFLSSLDGYITISLTMENTYELYPDETTYAVDRIVPAPPNFRVEYRILGGIEHIDEVGSGHLYVYADDGRAAVDQACSHIDLTDTRSTDPLQALIEILAVCAIDLPEDWDEWWGDWAEEHIQGLTGVGHEDGDSWYDVTVTSCSDTRLIGKEFRFGY